MVIPIEIDPSTAALKKVRGTEKKSLT